MNLTPARIRRVPSGIKRRVKNYLNAQAEQKNIRENTRVIPVDNLLIGGEQGIPAAHYALVVEDPLRPSRRVTEGAQVGLLRAFQEIGDRVLEPGEFEKTPYYKNGAECIDRVGVYFTARDPAHIVEIARRFVAKFSGTDVNQLPPSPLSAASAFSAENEPILVRPIQHSPCYEVINGHHRVAATIVRGEKEVTALSQGTPVLTPLQKMLLEVLWNEGRLQLYQPVSSPELTDPWVLIRKCTDRLEMMKRFLADKNIAPSHSLRYIDIGSSYGWFTAEMGRLGFDSYGVERDPIACSVGRLVYGNRPDQLFRSDCVRFLRENREVFDIVSCFSVLHHFALGRGPVSAEELIRLIDDKTGQVLFFDTGQNHEAWFRDSLPEWSVDYIEDWLRRNTRFRQIVRLGVDEDAVPPFEDNYRRTLFACVR